MIKKILIVIILLASFIIIYQSNLIFDDTRQISTKMKYNFDSEVISKDKTTIKQNIKEGDKYAQQIFKKISNHVIYFQTTTEEFSLSHYKPTMSDFPLQIIFSKLHLNDNKNSAFVTWHEIGHLIDWSSINDEGRQAFQKEFKKSKNWKNCFQMDIRLTINNPTNRCVNDDEIFADNFALWATNTNKSQSAYNVPRLITNKKMEQLLKQHYKPWINEPKRKGFKGWF